MKIETSSLTEKVKRRKRAEADYAANSRRLKRHCSRQHLNGGARALVPSVQRVYQQHASTSESSPSPENSEGLFGHPGPDNVASSITRSAEAGDVQGPESTAQKSPAHQDRVPASIVGRKTCCEQPLDFTHAVQKDGEQGQKKDLYQPGEDLRDEVPSIEDPKVLKPRGLGPKLNSVASLQGRGVNESPGPLLSPEHDNDHLSHEEVTAQAPAQPQTQTQIQVQEGPSLNLDDTPISSDLTYTVASPILEDIRPAFRPWRYIARESEDEDSDDDVLTNTKFAHVKVDGDLECQHDRICHDTVVNHLVRPYPVVVIGGQSSDNGYEYTDNNSDNSNHKVAERGHVGSHESAASAVDNQNDAEKERSKDSQGETTDLRSLSQLLGATSLGEPVSGGYRSNEHANNTPSPGAVEQNIRSSSDNSPYSDVETFDQDCSSEADSFYEDSDYSIYDYEYSDEEMGDEEAEYLSDLYESDDNASGPTISNMPSPPMATSGRRRLTTEERELVRQTREIGACVRCRFQKIKCFPDLRNPQGKCKTCKRFSKTSPKTIHRVPCLRLRITDIVLYRSGGLNLTRRWKGIEMRDISERSAMPSIVIEVSQNLCKKPIRMEVVEFAPIDGDVTARYWTEYFLGKATLKKKELAPYCLRSIYATGEYVRKYTVENALPAFLHTIQGESTSGSEGRPIFATYYTVVRRYMTFNKEKRSGNVLSPEDEKEVEILGNFIILWCAIQHTVGSLCIQGDETLGMRPETEDKSYPLYGKISAPRMIVAQFDNLVFNAVLEIYKERLLRDIDWLFSQDKNRWWFTIYNIIFILLREVSRMTADRYRHARDNFGPKLRYSIPAFVESLHESCNNILTHWHYYNCNKWPSKKDEKRAAHFESLTPDDLHLIKQTRRDHGIKDHLTVWKQYKNNNGKVNGSVLEQNPETTQYTGNQDKFDWDHPLYWVAQMFEKNWYPHPTYQRESVPRNPFPTPATTPV